MSYCCLTSNEIKFNFEYDDDYNVRFVLDEHVKLDFIVLAQLKHQSTGRHVAPIGHSILSIVLARTSFQKAKGIAGMGTVCVRMF